LVQEELLSFSIGDDNTRVRVAIALQESLTNALYYGNLECSSDLRQEDERRFYNLADERRAIDPYCSRRIHLEMRIDRDEARIDIRDDGPGFDVASLDKPFDPEDLMRIGGRGMILIRSFLDEVIHNKTGNQITLIKRK
jgi:anti-sigma regulatory factor (Ser/Thr protein kinase)